MRNSETESTYTNKAGGALCPVSAYQYCDFDFVWDSEGLLLVETEMTPCVIETQNDSEKYGGNSYDDKSGIFC